MKAFNPRVSIVIPVYNGSKYLGEAIDSALAQTYKNIEIIVVSDGSNDDGATAKVAKSYGEKIRFFDKKENGGAATALNLAIENMTGDYFSWLSHDDMYYPNKIERQVEELSKLSNKNTIILSDLDGINEKREKIYQTDYQSHIDAYPLRSKSRIHPVIYNQTHGCTLLIPKKCFETVGLFNPAERVAQDFEYFHRIFKEYPHRLVPEVLVTARDTSNRMGRRAKPRASIEYSRLYIKMIEELSDSDIKLLAKDRLTLLSDMWNFFKSAGYIPAYEYASTKIIEHAKTYCNNLLQDFLKGLSGKLITSAALATVEEQLDLVFADSNKALDYVDSSICQLVGEMETRSLNESIDRVVDLQDILQKADYKQSAAHLLQRIIETLSEDSRPDKLTSIINKKIIGDKKLLTDDLVNTLAAGKKGKNKARIAFCSTHWLTGGMERVMSIIFNELKDAYDIYLITPYDGRDAEILLPEGVTHIKISNSMFVTNFDSAALSISLILGVDVLVGFYNLFEKQLDLYGLCRNAGIKTISSNHENFFYPYTHYGLQKTALKRQDTYRSVDAVLWPTNFSSAVCGLDCQNSYLMPNPNTFKVTNTENNKREKVIVCVGRFNDYVKRVDRILHCFKVVQDMVPESKLILVGDCDRQRKNELLDDKSVDDMIFELGIDENNIIFTGKVSNVEDYYRQASVLVLTSNSEGFGMVINEAACFGVPSVCNKIPGIEDLVTHSENGYLTDQDDIKSMAEYVANVLSDEDLQRRLSSNAKIMVAKFDAVEIGNKWKYLINTLVESKPDDIKREELKKKLSYQVKDSAHFSNLILKELNGMVAKEADEKQKHQEIKATHGPLHKAKYSSIRLARSVKQRGVRRTAKILTKKTYHKTQRILSRS